MKTTPLSVEGKKVLELVLSHKERITNTEACFDGRRCPLAEVFEVEVWTPSIASLSKAAQKRLKAEGVTEKGFADFIAWHDYEEYDGKTCRWSFPNREHFLKLLRRK